MLPVEYEDEDGEGGGGDDGGGGEDEGPPVDEDLAALLSKLGQEDLAHGLAEADIMSVGDVDRSDDAALKKAGVSSSSTRRKLLAAAQKALGGGGDVRSASMSKGLNNVM